MRQNYFVKREHFSLVCKWTKTKQTLNKRTTCTENSEKNDAISAKIQQMYVGSRETASTCHILNSQQTVVHTKPSTVASSNGIKLLHLGSYFGWHRAYSIWTSMSVALTIVKCWNISHHSHIGLNAYHISHQAGGQL